MPIPVPRAGQKRHDYVKTVHDLEVEHGRSDDQAWRIAYESWRKYEDGRKVARGAQGREAESRLRMASAAATSRRRARR